METKVCNKCKAEKSITDYSIDSRNLDGLKSVCKICLSNYKKQYSQLNKDKIKEYNGNYRTSNIEKISEYAKVRYSKNKDKIAEYTKQYKLINKERDRLKNNKTKLTYSNNRMAIDPLYKLTQRIRQLISITLRNNGYKKQSKSSIILGCTFEQFKQHLESQFEDWMNWDNYGKYNGMLNYGWDIDHITPISSAKTEDEAILLNHYTNLRPLCSKTNREIKRNKISP